MVVEADVGYGEGVVYSVGFVYGCAFAGAEGDSVYVEGVGGGGCEGGPSLLLDVVTTQKRVSIMLAPNGDEDNTDPYF